ncbi:MAG: polysaccharide deacetylase family protein [Myxococcales bacterium]|nr:polysaccharide deacetylase family protein [Myxococcales bacterium]
MTETASVGVDVDSLRHYYRIHGLDEHNATNAAWRVGVPRFAELFDAAGVRATFYCIAEDLDLDGNADLLRELADAGHEIGNHTWHHPYALTRLDPAERRAEIEEGRKRLEAAAEAPVVGFRAPGYTTRAEVMADVAASGHRYDSSVFPCPPYYLAKAGVLGWMRLRGRESRSVLDTPRVLTAPRDPYRADPRDPYRRGDGLLEYPVSVALGVPLIGTAFTALGKTAATAAVQGATRLRRHLTLEFHAVDLLSLRDDGLDPALAVQPDLKTAVAVKRRIFARVLAALTDHARVERLDVLADEALLGHQR